MPLLLPPLPSTLSWLDDDEKCEEFCRKVIESFGIKDFATGFSRLPLVWHIAAMSVTDPKVRLAVIVVNAKSWKFSNALFRYRCLIHEACHAVSAFMIHEMSELERSAWLQDDGHGVLWRSLMELCGTPPDYRHGRAFYQREDVMDSLFPRRPHRADCWSCGGAFALSPGQLKKPWACPVCPGSVLQVRSLPQPEGRTAAYQYP